jgi:bacteriocin-like protein
MFSALDFQRVWRRKSEERKEKSMSNNNENRVLTRRGARQLTSEELKQISGGDGPFTRASHTGTNTINNPDTDFDS